MMYQPKLPLWTQQQTGLKLLLSQKVFALLMEMRTGKTATILAEFGNLVNDGSNVRDLLVVAPAGVYSVWVDDAAKHLSDEMKTRTKIHLWSAGPSKSSKGKKDETAFMTYQGPRILLVNVEALSLVDRARELCAQFLEQRPAMMVIDESTCIKGYKAERAKYCAYTLAPLAKRRRILSGLPSPQSPLDLYMQFYFLDRTILNYRTYAAFRARYAVTKRVPFGPRGSMIDIVVGYQRVDELAAKIAPYSYRVKLADCYDMPPKIYMRREVRMTAEQHKIYHQILEFSTAALDHEQHVTPTMVITQILRLHQVLCGHTTSDDGMMVRIKENRTAELLELLEDFPTDSKAVIWCSYDEDIQKVSKAIAEIYDPSIVYIDEWGNEKKREPEFPNNAVVSRFWGGNRAFREDEERRFKTEPSCRFMVATAAAGGKGRDWSVANLNVYYSNTANLEHRVQSEERPQAKGKMESVAYVDLVCRGTVEEKIIKALRDKIDLATAITGDGYKEWLI
jgi:SNF2 family DNA or RNA helicase